MLKSIKRHSTFPHAHYLSDADFLHTFNDIVDGIILRKEKERR